MGQVKAATHAGVGVLVAVDVEQRQNVDIHLVEQAGHFSVAAIGSQSLRTEVGSGAINNQSAATCPPRQLLLLTSLTNH